MSIQEPFTMEQFYKNMGQGKLAGGKCKKCGKLHFPPRPLCDRCLSKDFSWVDISRRGKLLTYTIIHVAPSQFQQMAPYTVGIVQLESGVKIPGMIKNVSPEQVKIGMPLDMRVEACTPTAQWPQWPRYHFVPA